MEKIAPKYLAESWDNVGFQIGDRNKMVNNIMIALDVTNTVVDEAIEKKADMIISHHPLIFKPLKSITMDNEKGNIIHKLIKYDIALYCSHTNLDMAKEGTNEVLARTLELEHIKPFIGTDEEKYFKIVVFVPESHVEDVRCAMGEEGAGYIGNYSCCTFSTKGTGTFMPQEGSNPYIGNTNLLEKVSEYRLETIVSRDTMSAVLDQMVKAHPYEEVAYDIFPLENKFEQYGLGRVGNVSPVTLGDFCEKVKQRLGLDQVRVVGDQNRTVKTVGVCSGSGAAFIDDAHRIGCDCFVTGDVKYHDAQYGLELGMAIIDAGHFETENIVCEALERQLNRGAIENSYDVNIFSSDANINPFSLL